MLLAQDIPEIGNPVVTGLVNPTQANAPAMFGKFFSGLVGLLLTIATIWAFVHLLIGGIEWLSSGGDKGKVENAQHHLTSAIIGLFIVFSVWAVYLVLLQFLGLSPSGVPGGGIQLKLPKLI